MRQGRKLTHEERMLWGMVARSARPLHGPLPQEGDGDAPEPPPEPAAGDGATVAPSPRPRVSAAQQQKAPPLNPIEQPVKRKIAKGRLPLEARIDLHGLMQAEAHDLLRAFLVRAHGRGLRHVLVITGKGSSRGSEGVLKRAVPQWLATPDFRPLVSGYETAARGHGGDGALYIRLKRRRGDAA